MSDKVLKAAPPTDIAKEAIDKVVLHSPYEPGDVIVARNGRDAYQVMKDRTVRKLPDHIAARHHARRVELIQKATDEALAAMLAAQRERDRVAALPWNRARRALVRAWVSFRLGCVAYFFGREAPSEPQVVPEPPPVKKVPARIARREERKKARAQSA